MPSYLINKNDFKKLCFTAASKQSHIHYVETVRDQRSNKSIIPSGFLDQKKQFEKMQTF